MNEENSPRVNPPLPPRVLLDVALLNALLVQVLDELVALHPVDERTDVAAVAEERPARQVDGTSCWETRVLQRHNRRLYPERVDTKRCDVPSDAIGGVKRQRRAGGDRKTHGVMHRKASWDDEDRENRAV
ncbi:hypothetical protein EYF80_060298 [Liparis tanakae]|uniref:Uncharacterized protein n=1 Tax=Liparis tanakae TaxID=230148 RepID=A0A4Z2EL37_9TELE|nr:hypothetical protein EYF80_060298 [Liparis tanakae]